MGNVMSPMATRDAHSDLLATGETDLDRGAWDEALASFERAVAADALEGLATAAFFLDEGSVAIDARERGYREVGRPVDASRSRFIAIVLWRLPVRLATRSRASAGAWTLEA